MKSHNRPNLLRKSKQWRTEVHIKSPVEKVVIDAKIVEWGGVQVNEQVSAMATEMTLKY